ncbi:PQQ-binding-like beta-propeller repeat protein [Gordonia sp. LSe1-13]|uniref:PQQ-binding-like beta-propeller repeat protein n=1 Tax=Gordonia sesuvii TaxID=3116777 RepID=A0ABU7M9T1_9ACTN|nr:PQQ-binding-like beta-propeller repeat protein [Gordonia sp. LSe1-13]
MRPQLSDAMWRGIFVACAVGLSVGASLTSLYAFVSRRPDRLVGGDLSSASEFLAFSLASTCLAMVLVGLCCWSVVRGRQTAKSAAWILAAYVSIAAWVYLSDITDAAYSDLSVPGAHPSIALAQLSWVVLACSAIALLAASVVPESKPVRGAGRISFIAASVVIAAVVPVGVGGAAAVVAHTATSAAPVPIPEEPASVGTQVAYRIESVRGMQVIPAGPGFVTYDGETVTAHDGATGAARWSTSADLADECAPSRVQSTGTSTTSVVLVGCAVDVDDPESNSYIMGVDAMTGERLWTNAENWTVRARSVTDSVAVAVSRVAADDIEIGSLDTRTGTVRWSRSAPNCFDPAGMATVDRSVVVAESCARREAVAVHVFDATSGNERRLRLPAPPAIAGAERVSAEIFAVSGASAAIRLQPDDDYGEQLSFLLDTEADTPEPLYGDATDPGYRELREGRYPGEVTQLRNMSYPDFVELLTMPGGDVRRIPGVRMLARDDLYADQIWAQVGDQSMTAAAYDGDYELVTVDRGGIVDRRVSPCGEEVEGGVTVVPGSVVLVCYPGRNDEPTRDGVEVIGLR